MEVRGRPARGGLGKMARWCVSSNLSIENGGRKDGSLFIAQARFLRRDVAKCENAQAGA